MSTPTTAVATLPRYHTRPHHYPHPQAHPSFPHSHHQSHRPGASATHRYAPAVGNNASPTTTSATVAASAIVSTPTAAQATTPSSSAAGRLLPFYQSAAHAGYAEPTDGVAQRTSAPRPPPHGHHQNHPNADYEHASDRPARHQHNQPDDHYVANMTDQPAKKRRRSNGPNWQEFYRNGLPNEIIVIDDDSPEPEANTSRKITNGNSIATTANTANNVVNNVNTAAVAANATATRQPTRKRRRDDDLGTTHGSGYHIQYVGSHTNTPAGSTISSDRTNSALHTTAPTSLSSNSQYGDSALPLKRKRTRQQVANEAKRRDTDVLGNRCFTYKPPPFPPKKASDVSVRMVSDVSIQILVQCEEWAPWSTFTDSWI